MSNFGEIAEPASRTFWEDWDEDAHENDYPKLQWQQSIEIPNRIETLIILEGKYLSNSVKKRKSNLELINSITEVNLNLYKSRTSNNYLCMIKDYDLLMSSEVVELMYQYITATDEVLAVLMKSLAQYQTSEHLPHNCLIRRLSTNVQSKSRVLKYSTLEQPNMISGVSAGVVCLREFLDMQASAVIFYIEHPETEDSRELQNLLAQLNIVWKPKPSGILNSNMYI